MQIDPAELPAGARYKLLIGGIVPRPIAFVSTVNTNGQSNLAPYSFFAGVGSDPMTLLFCPATQPDGRDKDSLRNALPPGEGGTGEFVVNVATEAYAAKVSAAAEDLQHGVSEFMLTGLTEAPCARVGAPWVAESPIAFECRTVQVVRTNPGVPNAGNIVIGEVVWVHVADEIVNERLHIDPDALRAIGRMGGLTYSTTRDRFDMPRGRAALERGV
ncbi:MAG: flavin reductase family protein [Planctomycetota bacterium]